VRILLTNNFFEPLTTGSTHFTRELAGQLVRNGHDVLVLTATPAASAALPNRQREFPVERVRAWRLNLGSASYNYDIPFASRPSVLRQISHLLREWEPDVIHQNGQFFDLSVITGLWARRHRVPTVLTVHTALLHEDPRFNRLLRFGDRYGVRPALATYRPHLVYADKRVGAYVEDRYPTFQRSSIGYPVDASGVRDGNGAAARELLDIGDRPMILSIGHVIPMRNRVLLTQALPEIRRRVPEVVVVVVGKLYDETFLAVADDLGVADAVLPVGPVPHDEVRHYLAAADVESHDLQRVGIGIATLEAMGAGVPIVTVNDADTFPYAPLVDGKDVLFADPTPDSVADRTVALLTDGALRDTIGAGGEQYVATHFSPEHVAAQYEALYAEVRGGSA